MRVTYPKILFSISVLINIILTVIIFATINEKQIYVYFNSDTLYLPSIFKDIFIDKSSFSGWYLNGAPNFFPDMFLFFIIHSFFNNFIPACFVFSLVQLSLILILLSILYKTIIKSVNYLHLSFGILLMSLFLFVTLVNNDFVYTFYLLSISYHLGAFIMCIFALIILLKYIQSNKKIFLIILLITSIISIINDRLFLVMFSFPLYAYIFICFINPKKRKIIAKLLIINSISIILGLFLFRMLRFSGYIHIISLSWKVFNFSNILPSLQIFTEQHLYYIKELYFRGFIEILFLISLGSHVVLLVKNISRIIKKKKIIEIEFLYLLFFVPFLVIVLFTPIINGSYVSWALLRYNIYSLYLGIFSYTFLIYKLQNSLKIPTKYLATVITIIILAESVFIISKINNNNISERLKKFTNYYPESVKCIDHLSKENNLKYGVAEYWRAKYITMFSKEDVRVYTVFDNLSPWYHVMNKTWYYKEGKGKHKTPEFSFVITNRLNKEKIIDCLGKPIDTLHCSNTEIYTFKEFQFNTKTKKPTIVLNPQTF